ncbi:MAG: NADH-quinone oxidoreductase subunit C [Candidatus Methanoperedens sp.]|nr:NADH-quinone oxidoreductase subunit C [Candidatus Methanoperedens sp.]MCZ7360552.1 NADH-quinone oxidoreductase subunit C [Candidatus Methanoperedens sp.]HLB69615.1 NADH-quinone oxidoreductase subunit C [Candidatus Methanoperedens sp.]
MNAAEELKQSFPESVTGVGLQTNKPLAVIKKEDLLMIAGKVKEMGFDNLSVVTGIDYVDHFEVIYNFFSYNNKQNLALKVILERENPAVDSLFSLYKVADWLERETYDLVGIRFSGHPNLVRILLPDGWEGHPLRKDYDMNKEQWVTIGEDGEDIVSTDGSGILRRK